MAKSNNQNSFCKDWEPENKNKYRDTKAGKSFEKK